MDWILPYILGPAVTGAVTAGIIALMTSRKMESLRFGFAVQLEQLKHEQQKLASIHQRRADGAASLWVKIRAVEDALEPLLRRARFEGEPSSLERLNKALAAANELLSTWDSIAIFLPELDATIEAFTEAVREIVRDYRWSETKGEEPKERRADFDRAKERLESTLRPRAPKYKRACAASSAWLGSRSSRGNSCPRRDQTSRRGTSRRPPRISYIFQLHGLRSLAR